MNEAFHVRVRVCVCVCVCVRARGCVCVWWGGGTKAILEFLFFQVTQGRNVSEFIALQKF